MNSDELLQYAATQISIDGGEVQGKGESNARKTLPIIGHVIAWTIWKNKGKTEGL